MYSDSMDYERVTINRADKTITSELIRPRPGLNERLFEKGIISGTDGQTIHNHYVFDHQGIKTWKVEFFRSNVERVLKAIKFRQFETEQ